MYEKKGSKREYRVERVNKEGRKTKEKGKKKERQKGKSKENTREKNQKRREEGKMINRYLTVAHS